MSQTWLVMGLGNPGTQYERTRHNVGQMVIGNLAERMGGTLKRHKAGAMVMEGRAGIGGPRVVLARSTGYMNTSGGPTAGLASFYGIDPEHVIAVHDEIDIPFDAIRLKRGGGEGGHNGLRDITKALGTKEYLRVRVGVGRPPGRMDAADYVLKPFTAAEAKQLPVLVEDAADAVVSLMVHGLTDTQQQYHSRG
ncbi:MULTISPECIES: aminoacyl-tRNA hydrolase [Rothia]|uniref:Peptidyl-tRNA hydrolase n=1 Tax=Rothia kristinae TaxID=37923 RepID=A0A0Q2XIK6_9MICC|nr:aminoacyl-tRNA hydrolase [Rothia kristinae]MBE8526642.1 aminoacyl-tRNA hydrolase [Amycolatopsis sp. H6(2020)]MDN5639778.1 aminoacyl-tRNA hydrolase [Actinomycetes bacterium]TDP56143.1 PTH1 family peptidyl-tRNA hydrolase [Kocuria sp. AG109]SIM05852.1 peptidyl-tRNA hydrolase [Mycobacteroides abscessus subsp. abscessus]KTR39292.1 peptidyl-tRNA hydrolase [Rothia kristinae]